MIVPLIFGGQLVATKRGISLLPMPIPKLTGICSLPMYPTMNMRSIERIEHVHPIFSESSPVKRVPANVERSCKFIKVVASSCYLFPNFPFSEISKVMTAIDKPLRLAIAAKSNINNDNVQLIEIDKNITTNIYLNINL